MKLYVRVFLTVCVAIIYAQSFEWTRPYAAEPQGVQASCSGSLCGQLKERYTYDDCMYYIHADVKIATYQGVKITHTPDPPQMGKNVNITITGDLSES